jgi:hypothetical protein
MAKLGATFPLKQMTAYERCMKIMCRAKPPLHGIDDHKRDKECLVVEEKIA